MEIKINQAQIEEAINDTASEAIAEALGGYEVRKSIGEVVTAEVATGAIQAAIAQAVKNVDTAKLTAHLAAELERATTRTISHLLEEGLLATVCTLRGIGDYGEANERKRAELKAELFGTHRRGDK